MCPNIGASCNLLARSEGIPVFHSRNSYKEPLIKNKSDRSKRKGTNNRPNKNGFLHHFRLAAIELQLQWTLYQWIVQTYRYELTITETLDK